MYEKLGHMFTPRYTQRKKAKIDDTTNLGYINRHMGDNRQTYSGHDTFWCNVIMSCEEQRIFCGLGSGGCGNISTTQMRDHAMQVIELLCMPWQHIFFIYRVARMARPTCLTSAPFAVEHVFSLRDDDEVLRGQSICPCHRHSHENQRNL